MRLLVVDDDSAILKLISRVLRDESYAIDVASTGEEARMLALVNEYDGIILDLQLGDRHGFEILQELRRNGRRTPVLLYSGLSDTETIVRGLDAGADDYLTKPFAFPELAARIRALVRRDMAAPRPTMRIGNLALDAGTVRATSAGASLPLSSKEFALLWMLATNAGEALRRVDILREVWGTVAHIDANVVDQYVSYLRRKLDPAVTGITISTLRGIGYRLTVAD